MAGLCPALSLGEQSLEHCRRRLLQEFEQRPCQEDWQRERPDPADIANRLARDAQPQERTDRGIVSAAPSNQAKVHPRSASHDVRDQLLERLAEIGCPTLVISGALDDPAFLDTGAFIAREVPGARRIVIPDAGHMVNMEQPAAFNRAVRSFIIEAGADLR